MLVEAESDPLLLVEVDDLVLSELLVELLVEVEAILWLVDTEVLTLWEFAII
ncbi:hypothetical protein N219_07085 [Limosilactobacillus fermentum MTCC 8711]|nr:hypothetical protein N219_07085 [Limosilactobacillus fermentum MTCC 8711]